jgi:hypothetical protein
MSTTIVINKNPKPIINQPSTLDRLIESKTETPYAFNLTVESYISSLKADLNAIECLVSAVDNFNKKYTHYIALTMPHHFSVLLSLSPLYEGTSRRLGEYLMSNSNFRIDPLGPNIVYYDNYNKYQISNRYYLELADILNSFLEKETEYG